MAYIEIPEEKILQTVSLFESSDTLESPRYLIAALHKGAVIRENGLTPFYIFIEEEGTIIITSRENMDKKLH